MGNTLIQEGGQGSDRITDTALHDYSATPIGVVEILEDDTDFDTVNMQTRDNATPEDTQAWQASVQIAGTATAPGFGTGHKKGEFISGIFDTQRFIAIKLSAGSCRGYFT